MIENEFHIREGDRVIIKQEINSEKIIVQGMSERAVILKIPGDPALIFIPKKYIKKYDEVT